LSDIDSEREVILEEIAMYEDDPQEKVFDLLGEATVTEDEADRLGWARLDRPPERRTTVGSTWHARRGA